MLGFHKPNSDERLDAFKRQLKAVFDADPGIQKAFLFGVKATDQQVGRVTLFIQRNIKRGEATLTARIHTLYDSSFEDAAPGPLEVVFFDRDPAGQLIRAGAPFYVRPL